MHCAKNPAASFAHSAEEVSLQPPCSPVAAEISLQLKAWWSTRGRGIPRGFSVLKELGEKISHSLSLGPKLIVSHKESVVLQYETDLLLERQLLGLQYIPFLLDTRSIANPI